MNDQWYKLPSQIEPGHCNRLIMISVRMLAVFVGQIESLEGRSVSVDMATISGDTWQDGSSSGSSGMQDDPDLQAIVNAWATLPDPVKAAVMALVKADTADD